MSADVEDTRLQAIPVSVQVPMIVSGQYITGTIDTGSEITLLSKNLFDKIFEGDQSVLKPSNYQFNVADQNQIMENYGSVDVEIILGDFKFHWPVCVAPLREDFLLGCDIFDNFRFTFNTHHGLFVNGKWIECVIYRKETLLPVSNVVLKEDTTIPANCEFIAVAHKIDEHPGNFALFEPNKDDDIIVAHTLVDVNKDEIPVRIINTSEEILHLDKARPIGTLQPFEEISDREIEMITNDVVSICRNTTEGFRHKALHKINPDPDQVKLNKEKSGISLPIWPAELHSKIPSKGPSDIPTIENICINEVTANLTNDNSHLENTVPDHLKELYERACQNIPETEFKNCLATLLRKHEAAFAKNKHDLGNCGLIKHRIITNGAAPIRQPLRRTPQGFESEEEEYLKQQLDAGVIEPSSSAWASPVVLVRKKDNSVRWCIDYRKLNDITIKDAYPLPRIDLCLDCLSSAKIFSTMDLQSGYFQLQLDDRDREKTAFITKYGLYQYTRLPQGLATSPSTFQRTMELVFRGLQWKHLLIYLDDLIIYSTSWYSHFEKLDEVFTLLEKANLKLKPAKCHLLQEEVLFLGHVVDQSGIRPNPELLQTIDQWEAPTTVKQIQQFMGLCNYYRRFIKDFSKIASPITQLTKKNIPFRWTSDCENAFQLLKTALSQPPVLAYPQPVGLYVLDTDASDTAIGCCLSQIQNGEERAICFGSKKLDSIQSRYCVTRRELLAAVTFINQFRHYLLGKHFILRTDHSSLRWLCGFKAPQGQLARWLETLAEYDFEIIHRSGKKHQNADSFSRMWQAEPACDQYRPDIPVKELPCGGCPKCVRMHHEWSRFHEKVDNVVQLSRTIKCQKVSTRSERNAQTKSASASTDSSLKQRWLPGYTALDLSKMQREDPDLKFIHLWFDENNKPDRDTAASMSPAVRKYWLNYDNLYKVNDVVYQKHYNSTADLESNFTSQLLVPRVLRREILQHNHNTVFAAHLGVGKTAQKIKQHFYWYRMDEDVKIHLRQCDTCSANRRPSHKPKAPLKDYLSGSPMDRIAIDILGPLPCSRRNNSYILVVADYFTRFVEAYPIPDQQAETVAHELVHQFVSRYGVPLELHSDQGRNFESSLFQQICEMLEIKKTRSSPYRPSSNGLVERFNLTLMKMVRCFVEENKTDWDQYLPLLTAAY